LTWLKYYFRRQVRYLLNDSALKKKVLNVIVILLLIVGSGGLFVAYNKNLSDFLSGSQVADANVLILEGWLHDDAIEMLKQEILKKDYDLFLIAGVKTSDLDFFKLPMNGHLIFYAKSQIFTDTVKKEHLIEISAKSKMGGIYQCHFNFYINDSIVADFVTDEHPGKTSLKWNGALRNIDSLMVQFTNDMFDANGDRDLFVKEIIIDNQVIIPYQHNSVYDIGAIGGGNRTVNAYESHPQIIRNKLISFGLDSVKVVALTTKMTTINRTLVSAIAVRDWLKSSGQSVKGINVVSRGIHSRRTLLTYKKVLNKTDNIGIISLPERFKGVSGENSAFRIFVEMLDYLYYNIILIPFMWSSN